MSNTFHLIRKDFVLIQKMLLLFIPYYLIMGYTLMDQYTMFTLFPAMLLLVNGCTLDVQQNNQRFLVSLPLKRQDLVKAKYMALVPYALFSFGCTLVLYAAAYAIGRVDTPPAWREIALMLLFFFVLASFYLPLHYWLGQKGTQIVNFIFIMLIMLNVSAFHQLLEWFPAAGKWISTGSAESFLPVLLLTLGCMILVYSSYLLSSRIFSSKDI
ncbi:ABC-2 transporter permease ['Paenibacillus yunnanensis' Narsing Rao et al. 2020]|uniref:ABC-2 transporter permease n=1 Tax=Paenibacillus tengchongensis TaxID=2608684 RepID=UPI00124E8438|nr:ABC-2 transporter permease [Paenibacillus tengchongensis]